MFRYVACEHGPRAALCAVLTEGGKAEQVDEVLADLRYIIELLEGQTDEDPLEWLASVWLLLVKDAGDIIRLLKKQRFLRFLLKRLFLINIIIETMEKIAELAHVTELLLGLASKAKPLLEACSCPESTNEVKTDEAAN